VILRGLASCFLPAESIELLPQLYRAANTRITQRTWQDLPLRRLPWAPHFILVGPKTASSAEALAFVLQQLGRAIIVGRVTAGASTGAIDVPLLADGFVPPTRPYY